MQIMHAFAAALMITTVYGAASTELVQQRSKVLAKQLFSAIYSYNIPNIQALLEEVHPDACGCVILGGVLSRFLVHAHPHPSIPTIFRMLVNAGATIDARNMTGGTVLHILATSELPNRYVFPCMKIALDAGIDTTVHEHFCDGAKTALQWAEHKLRQARLNAQRCKFFEQRLPMYASRIAFLNDLIKHVPATDFVLRLCSDNQKIRTRARQELASLQLTAPARYAAVAQYLNDSLVKRNI